MTDTSYDLCPTCGREEIADICPACCGVEQRVENLVDDILAQCREKAAHAEEISERKELTDRAREERRHQVADLSWTLATLRHVKRQIGA